MSDQKALAEGLLTQCFFSEMMDIEAERYLNGLPPVQNGEKVIGELNEFERRLCAWRLKIMEQSDSIRHEAIAKSAAGMVDEGLYAELYEADQILERKIESAANLLWSNIRLRLSFYDQFLGIRKKNLIVVRQNEERPPRIDPGEFMAALKEERVAVVVDPGDLRFMETFQRPPVGIVLKRMIIG